MRANRLIGRRVAGRFTIKRFLGEGGMATVFVAEQDQEPREVALKIMNEDLNADRTFAKRFQREATAAARVQHPNSVAFIDYGVADGLSYIAMELLSGDDLYVLLEREGAITQGRAARLVVEVCDALMVAHELGIVHRDLKPENIMVIEDPAHPCGERVKVLDFGIAKLLAPDMLTVDPRLDPASGVTRAGTFIGTPAYMSPEQCALLSVDTRADIYTCGVLLFQLVTGRLPFEGQTPLHTATLHIHEQPPRPSSLAPSIDPRLEAVILKALAKKPTERHQTARHLAATLRKLLPDLPDVKVGKVGKPQPGSLRPRGSTRNSISDSNRPAAGRDSQAPGAMDSAKTMVAPGELGPPPAVVLRADIAPLSDPSADSTPARIRPAAGRDADATSGARVKAPPPAPQSSNDAYDGDATLAVPIPVASLAPRNPPGRDFARPPPAAPILDDDSSADSDDSLRTLVRPPAEDDAPRFGPQHTTVIPVEEAATPPPLAALPAPRPAAGAPAPRAPAPPPRVAAPRLPNPTLKSAVEFKGSERASAPERAPESSAEVAVAAVVSVGGRSALGAIHLGSAQLTSGNATMGAPLGSGPSAVLTSPQSAPAPEPPLPPSRQGQVVITPATATTKMQAPDPASLAAGQFMATAQTVPLISPSLVASIIAAGPPAPRPAAGAPAVRAVEPMPVSMLAPPSMPASMPAPMSGPAPLPQTPPIYPLEPAPPAGISGTRGLLIGFLAGALLMGLAAAAYFLFGR